jgi:transcription elongation factor GreA
MKNEYVVTKEGLVQLQEELAFRSGPKRMELRQSMDAMKAAGDISENEGLELTIEETHLNDARVAELEKILEVAVVKDAVVGEVHLGSEVTLEGEDKKTYRIVGEEEANPLEGKISYLSPLGEKLMKKKSGATVTFQKPNGTESTYKITKIA